MSFQLAPEASEKNVFLAQLSELEDRYDPEMVLFRRRSHNFLYPARKLREFFRLPPQYGANEPGIERESLKEPRYVRITDINDEGLLNDELGATAEEIEPQYLLNENDLLFARSGNTVGKSYIHKKAHAPYECFFAGYLIRLSFNTDAILPDYVFALTQLPYYKSWVKAIQRTSGQPNINAQEYANLEICAAPLRVQAQVVEHLEAAYARKRDKDAQAKAQLARIDAILLEQLGLTPPPPIPDTVQSRCFVRPFSEVTGGRFDPHFQDPKFDSMVDILNSVNAQPLALLSANIFSGITPKSGGDAYTEDDDGIAFVRSGDFNEDKTIRPSGLLYIKPEIHEGQMQGSQLRRGDVLFAIVGATIGKVGLFNEDYQANINQAVCAVRVSDSIRSGFLHAFFLSFFGKEQINRIKRPVARANINLEEIGTLRIPVPSVSIQRRIEDEVNDVFAEKKRLENEAQTELDAAKIAVEAMILGDK